MTVRDKRIKLQQTETKFEHKFVEPGKDNFCTIVSQAQKGWEETPLWEKRANPVFDVWLPWQFLPGLGSTTVMTITGNRSKTTRFPMLRKSNKFSERCNCWKRIKTLTSQSYLIHNVSVTQSNCFANYYIFN